MAINRYTLQLLRGMRIQIGADVDAHTTEIAQAWGRAWNDISRDLDDTIRTIQAGTRDGKPPTRALINRVLRDKQTLAIVRAKLDGLSEFSNIRTMQLVDTTVTRGAQFEAQLIASQMPPGMSGLAAMFDRASPGALQAIVERTRGQITALHKPLSPDATRAIKFALVRGVAAGDSPDTVARNTLARARSGFDGGLNRARVIARTELLDAHRNGAMAQDLANPETVTGWQWIASLDKRTCPACLSKHGETFPPDKAGPDDHQQGRCARAPVTKSWAELGFKGMKEPPSLVPDAQAWFNDQSPADQLQIMGRTRLDALNNGAPWSSLATRRTTPGWRDSWAPTPASALK